MTTESQSRELDEPVLVRHIGRRRGGWPAAVTVVVLVAVAAAISLRNSNRPENCYLRGLKALHAGHRDAALRESRRLIGTPGFESQGRLLSGLLLIRDGRPAEALPELQLAAQGETTAGEALTAAAECYYVTDRYVDAIHTARAALARNTEALDARRWLAAAYYDLGATAYAVEELETISAQAPADCRSERLLGLIYKDNERFAEAVGHYHESLRRNSLQPDRQSILIELAEVLVKLSRMDEARETLQDCNPSAKSLTLAAECDESLGRLDDARERLREALDLDPNYVPASLIEGRLLLYLGRADEASRVLQGAVHLAPGNSLAHFLLSQACSRQGEHARSAEHLRLFQKSQQIERRYIDFRGFASQRPDDPEIRYRLGVLARQLDKPDMARTWFRAALALEPAHAATLAALSEADDSSIRP